LVKRWAVAIAAGLATFVACWWGLEVGAGWLLGDALGLAAAPFTVVFGLASYWAGRERGEGGSEEKTADEKPSAVVSSIVQIVDHPGAPVLAGDYRGAHINFGPSHRVMILTIAAIVIVDTAAIVAAISTRPATTAESGAGLALSVPGPPWVAVGNGAADTLNRGDPIKYAFYVDNSTGRAISANIRFDAYWGIRDELPVNIFNIRFQTSIPPGRTTVYSPLTRIPGTALPGMYTEQADVADRFVPADRAGQYGLFYVTGQDILGVPCYVQPVSPPLSGADGGPASVAMVLNYRHSGEKPSVADIQEFMASYLRDHEGPSLNGPVSGEELENALEHYGVPESEITEISQAAPGLPWAQLTAMAIAIKRGTPVIAFVDAKDLPAPDHGERDYTAHWLVVVGFSLRGGDQPEVLVNDPDGTPGYGGVKGQAIALRSLEQAITDAAGMPVAQQEPDRISGIVATAP
jgi:hypothetical protein